MDIPRADSNSASSTSSSGSYSSANNAMGGMPRRSTYKPRKSPKKSKVMTSTSSFEKQQKYNSLHFFSDFSALSLERFKVREAKPSKSLNVIKKSCEQIKQGRKGSNVLIDLQYSDPDLAESLYANVSSKDESGFNYIGLNESMESDNIPGWYDRSQGVKADFATMVFGLMQCRRKPNVTIEINGEVFEGHLLILQIYSQLFQAVTTQNWISLSELGVPMTAFFMVYEWMLAMDTPLIRRHTILPLLNAATIMMIDELEEQCWRCLDDDRVVREYDAFVLYQESKMYRNLGLLRELLLARVCKYFLALVASPAYLDLEVDEVCSLLSAHSIAVNCEAEVMMAGIRWLKHKEEEREEHILTVMSCVRFILMPTTYLVTLKDRHVCEETAKMVRNEEIQQRIITSLRILNLLECRDMSRADFGYLLVENRHEIARERQWILDDRCDYHHHLLCRKKTTIRYSDFEKYLDVLRESASKYWVEYPFAELCLDANAEKCPNPKCVNSPLIFYRELTNNPLLCQEFGLNVLGQSSSAFNALHEKLDVLQAKFDRKKALKVAQAELEATSVPPEIREKTLRCYGARQIRRLKKNYRVKVTKSSLSAQLVQGSSLRDQDSFKTFETFHGLYNPHREEDEKPVHPAQEYEE